MPHAVRAFAASLTGAVCPDGSSRGAHRTLWRHTRLLDDDDDEAESAALRDWLGGACAAQRPMYGFGMALRGAWEVRVPQLEEAYAEAQAEVLSKGSPSLVRRFFHGTRRDSAA